MESNEEVSRRRAPGTDDAPAPGARRSLAGNSPNSELPVTERSRRSTTGRRRPVKTTVVRRGGLARALRLVLGIVLIVGGIVGIAAFRISRGAISLNAFKGAIEGAISAELGENSIFIRDAELALGGDGIEVALLDIRINGPSGVALVQAPRAVMGLSGQAALRGSLGFTKLELVSPRLQFFYAEDGTLSVKFAQASEGVLPTPTDAPVQMSAVADVPPASQAEASGSIDFIKALTDISAQARRREHVTAYLREIGLKQMTVVVDNGRRKTIWRVPEVKIDLSHKTRRSLIEGRATIDGLTGPWSLDFKTAEVAGSEQMTVEAQVTGLNPRGLSRQILSLAPFEAVDVALDGTAQLDVTAKGGVNLATFALTARPGKILPSGIRTRTGAFDGGSIKGSYDAASSRFNVGAASISVDDNRIDLTGAVTRAPVLTTDGFPLWIFDFKSTGGYLAPTSVDGRPIPIDQFNARGQIVPEARRLVMQQVDISAGGAAIAATASINDLATDPTRTADLEARIASMPIAKFIGLWPSTIAPEARSWLASHLVKGQLNSGVLKVGNGGDSRMSMTLDVGGAELVAAKGFPSVSIPRGLLRVEGGGLELTVPDASIGPDGKRLLVKGLRFTAVETTDGAAPLGEIAFRIAGPLATALDLADREPFRLLKSRGISLPATEGKLDGQIKLTLPLAEATQASDMKIEGRVRLADVRLRQALGPHDIAAGKLDLDLSDTAIDGRGDFLLKGVPVKISGQHFFNTTADRQAPVRLTLKLDDSDRAQLGLDINDLITGDVPVEITVTPDAKGEYLTKLDADLTKAELTLDSVAFKKPSGAQARLQFEIFKVGAGRTELRNFKIAGDSIAGEGLIVLGADNKARELSFPNFSLNTVTRLDVQGQLRSDNIWEVKAKGSTFDGRELFRELFNVQNHAKPAAKERPGLDMTAEIDTVIGFNETNLKSVRLKLQKRTENGIEKTTSLDVAAMHDGGKSFQARIRSSKGERALIATSQDAGQTFKAVGFYPNANGGDMNLELSLDGRGAVERNGVLKADRFFVLGDPIISEVYQNTDGATQQQSGAPRKVVRERFDFDWMVLPFSVGCGQFVMNDVEIRGPLVGARMRGKADFKSQRLQIGGTYIPLSGLNSAIGGLPVLGQLLAGPKGEGIFGITFAIQGPMGNPEVLVNPLSGIVPGILRETQQLTPDSYKITPCSERGPGPQRVDAVRASSAIPAVTGANPAAATPRPAKPDVITDWSSDTRNSRQK